MAEDIVARMVNVKPTPPRLSRLVLRGIALSPAADPSCCVLWLSSPPPGKWSTVLFDHPGYTSGRHIWSVQLVQAEPRCGMAVGIAHLDAGFVPASHNIGAHEHSWAYSKTGKKGSGEGFQKYGLAYAPGDIITCILDMDEGWIRFMLNGLDQVRNETSPPHTHLVSTL